MIALILRKISPSTRHNTIYIHLDALEAFISQHSVTLPAALGAVLRRWVAMLPAALRTFTQPGPPRLIFCSSIAVTMSYLLFAFIGINVSMRGIVGS